MFIYRNLLRQGSRVLSVLIEVRWLSQNQLHASMNIVVGFQVVGATLRQVTASAESIGYILTVDPPACDSATCKGTANISSPATYGERSGHVSSYHYMFCIRLRVCVFLYEPQITLDQLMCHNDDDL